MTRQVPKRRLPRDHRDVLILQQAAIELRRRTQRDATDAALSRDEQAAIAAVLDSAGRQLDGLALGLRSDLLAAADIILRGADNSEALS